MSVTTRLVKSRISFNHRPKKSRQAKRVDDINLIASRHLMSIYGHYISIAFDASVFRVQVL